MTVRSISVSAGLFRAYTMLIFTVNLLRCMCDINFHVTILCISYLLSSPFHLNLLNLITPLNCTVLVFNSVSTSDVRTSDLSATKYQQKPLSFVPRGTEALVDAWKSSVLYQNMVAEIDAFDHSSSGYGYGSQQADLGSTSSQIPDTGPSSESVHSPEGEGQGLGPRQDRGLSFGVGSAVDDEEKEKEMEKKLQVAVPFPSQSTHTHQEHEIQQVEVRKRDDWPMHYKEKYPGTFFYHLNLTFVRQFKLTSRDTTFIKSRVGQCVLVGAIAGSLFSNLAVTDTTTRAGFLFYVVLFNAFSSFAMIPICYEQKVRSSNYLSLAYYTVIRPSIYMNFICSVPLSAILPHFLSLSPSLLFV